LGGDLAPYSQAAGSLLRTPGRKAILKKWSGHSSNFANFYILAYLSVQWLVHNLLRS